MGMNRTKDIPFGRKVDASQKGFVYLVNQPAGASSTREDFDLEWP